MEEIAKLIASVGFKVDDKELVKFTQNLDALEVKLKEFRKSVAGVIKLNMGVDKRSLTALKGQVKTAIKEAGAESTLRVTKVSLPTRLIQESLNSRPFRLGFKLPEVRVTEIKVSKSSLALAFKIASDPLVLRINKVIIQPMALVSALTKASQNLTLRINKVLIPVMVMRAAIAQAANGSTLRLERVFISKAALRDAMRHAAENQALKNFKIEVKVNPQLLRDSINKVLEDYKGRLRLLAAGPGGSSGHLHAGAAGGLLGAASGGIAGFLPGFGGAYAIANLNRINQELQANTLAMTAVTGSEAAGNETSGRFRAFADEVGIDYRATQPSFTKMLASGMGAGMEQGDIENIFKGTAEYGRVMGLGTEEMKGTFKALEQMMNKGQVMSEELKGRLAERMPGVVSAMTEAAGFGDPSELFAAMEKGQVKSDVLTKFADILSKRAREGGALTKAMESTAAQQARFNNAFSDMVKVFAKSGFDKAMADFFKNLADGLARSTSLVAAFGNAFKWITAPIEAVVALVGRFSEMLPSLSNYLGVSKELIVGLGVAAGVAMLPFGPFILAISALLLIMDDLSVYMRGGDSVFGDFMDMMDDSTFQAIEGYAEALSKITDSLIELGKTSFDGWSQIFGFFTGDAEKGSQKVINDLTQIVNLINQIITMVNNAAKGNFGLGEIPKTLKGVVTNQVDKATTFFPPRLAAEWAIDKAQTYRATSQFDYDKKNGNLDKAIEQTKQRMSETAPADRLGPVPIKEVNISIDGARDPQAVADAVLNTLKYQMFGPAQTAHSGENE